MNSDKTCRGNRLARWLRIIISLAIIGSGIYFHNWIGLLGILPLISALTGHCSLTLRIPRRPDFHWHDPRDPQ